MRSGVSVRKALRPSALPPASWSAEGARRDEHGERRDRLSQAPCGRFLRGGLCELGLEHPREFQWMGRLGAARHDSFDAAREPLHGAERDIVGERARGERPDIPQRHRARAGDGAAVGADGVDLDVEDRRPVDRHAAKFVRRAVAVLLKSRPDPLDADRAGRHRGPGTADARRCHERRPGRDGDRPSPRHALHALPSRKDVAGSFGMIPTTPHPQKATSPEGDGANVLRQERSPKESTIYGFLPPKPGRRGAPPVPPSCSRSMTRASLTSTWLRLRQ
jgi:hypothetical protein